MLGRLQLHDTDSCHQGTEKPVPWYNRCLNNGGYCVEKWSGGHNCICIVYVRLFVCLFVQLHTAALRLIVRSWLDVPTFATRLLHSCHHARASSSRRWNCGREMSGNFAEMTTSTPFRDLLHAVKLWHGTNRFYFPSEGRCAEDFFALKIRWLQLGVNPRTWISKASTLPLDHQSRYCLC